MYDKERGDGAFAPQDPVAPPSSEGQTSSSEDSSSQREWDPMDNIFVTIPPWHPAASVGAGMGAGRAEKEKAVKNPVSHWRVSRRSVVGTLGLLACGPETDWRQILYSHPM